MIWRLILAKVATLEEIERHWSLTDLLDGNDALDLQADLEAEARARAKENG